MRLPNRFFAVMKGTLQKFFPQRNSKPLPTRTTSWKGSKSENVSQRADSDTKQPITSNGVSGKSIPFNQTGIASGLMIGGVPLVKMTAASIPEPKAATAPETMSTVSLSAGQSRVLNVIMEGKSVFFTGAAGTKCTKLLEFKMVFK